MELFQLSLLIFRKFQHQFKTYTTKINRNNSDMEKKILIILIVNLSSVTAMKEQNPYGSGKDEFFCIIGKVMDWYNEL